MIALPNVLTLQPHELRGKQFTLEPLVDEQLRVEIYEPPVENGVYAIGFDAAYGIPGRDCDAAAVLQKNVTPIRQVAEVQGWIGERWDRVMYALARWYNEAFIVGERQGGGIATLNRLWHDYGYRYVYYNRNQQAVIEPASNTRLELGHHRVHDDVTLRDLRLAVLEDDLDLRSEQLIAQMARTEFREARSTVANPERREDAELKIKLAGGGSPDLVMALVYAWLGVREVALFPKPKEPYAPGTYGADFGHDELEGRQDPAHQVATWGRRKKPGKRSSDKRRGGRRR